MSGVSLPGLAVSLSGVGVALNSLTVNMPAKGESLAGIGVSLLAIQNMTPATPQLVLSNRTASVYAAVITVGTI